MIDIKHGRLAALKENGIAAVKSIIDDQGHVAHHRLNAIGEGQEVVGDFSGVQGRQTHGLENRVLGGECGLDLGTQRLGVEEVLDADTDAVHLVRVGRANATSGRADLVIAARTLVGLVHKAVVGGDDVRVCRDQQARAVHASCRDGLDFIEKNIEVNDDAVTDDRGNAFGEDSRGQEVEGVLLAIDDDRVSRVVAAVEFNDVIGVLSQLVGSFSLAFVAPLGAENDDGGHVFSVIQCVERVYEVIASAKAQQA